jgi:GTPase SAR1 family protein
MKENNKPIKINVNMKNIRATISVLGDSGVGKTALSTFFISKEYNLEYEPTSKTSFLSIFQSQV